MQAGGRPKGSWPRRRQWGTTRSFVCGSVRYLTVEPERVDGRLPRVEGSGAERNDGEQRDGDDVHRGTPQADRIEDEQFGVNQVKDEADASEGETHPAPAHGRLAGPPRDRQARRYQGEEEQP